MKPLALTTLPQKKRSTKTNLNPKILATALLVVAFATSCGTRKAPAMPSLSITVAPATTQSLPTTLTLPGQTYSLSDTKIQPRTSGYLTAINYSDGMPVKKGQLLATIETRPATLEVTKAQAQLASAQAQLVEAQNNYDRSVPLARINAVSKSALDQATAALAAALASQKSAAAALASAQLNLSYTAITAPNDGIMGTSLAQIGDYVGSGTQYPVINTLSEIDSIYVYLSIPTSRYLQMVGRDSTGAPLIKDDKLLSNIRLTLTDGTPYNHPGVYKYTQHAASNVTGSVVLNVLFPNPERTLKPGEFVRVTANIGPEKTQIVIPQKAVMQSQGVNSVFVLGKNNTALYRQITLGPTVGDMWCVTDGLRQGEKVLTDGLQKVRSGMTINPITK